MRIEGLTAEQVKILDELWACETMEDLERYVANKSDKQLQEIITLREMIMLSHIDEQVEMMGEYPDVEFMIRNLKL
jgi:hypothetical protein